jgi:hypothetical protein
MYHAITLQPHLNLTDLKLVGGEPTAGMLLSLCMLVLGVMCLPDATRFLSAARAPMTDTSCFSANMPAVQQHSSTAVQQQQFSSTAVRQHSMGH